MSICGGVVDFEPSYCGPQVVVDLASYVVVCALHVVVVLVVGGEIGDFLDIVCRPLSRFSTISPRWSQRLVSTCCAMTGWPICSCCLGRDDLLACVLSLSVFLCLCNSCSATIRSGMRSRHTLRLLCVDADRNTIGPG